MTEPTYGSAVAILANYARWLGEGGYGFERAITRQNDLTIVNGDYFLAVIDGKDVTIHFLAEISPSFAAMMMYDILGDIYSSSTNYNVIPGQDYTRVNGKIKFLNIEEDQNVQ